MPSVPSKHEVPKVVCYVIQEGHLLVFTHDTVPIEVTGVQVPAGTIEAGESPEECVLREVREETGLTMTEFAYRGLITFVSDEWGTEYMHLFTCTAWTGELIDCDEGELVWLPKSELLKKKMWEGDRLFLKALDTRRDFFTLKLVYRGETLVSSTWGAAR